METSNKNRKKEALTYKLSNDLGQVIKLTPSSSTHLRRKRVRLQIPQTSATVQRKEKKETEN